MFGRRWHVAKENDNSLICTESDEYVGTRHWSYNCNDNRRGFNECDNWRLLVWADGIDESGEYRGYSTISGNYYGGHSPCENGDNMPKCGDWRKVLG